MTNRGPSYLEETYYFDYRSKEILELISEFRHNAADAKSLAIGLYKKVRDGWRYNASNVSVTRIDYKASNIYKKESAHCIDKSTLLIAGLRALGIPARLELAKIKNHLAVERLIELIGTDELVPHGYVGIYIENKWVKASPAFNKELCDYYKVAPLEFDAEHDSIFQEYNREGNVFMEYLEYYGDYSDVPLDFIFGKWKEYYPYLGKRFIN